MSKIRPFDLWRLARKADPETLKRAQSYMSDPDAWLVQSLSGGPPVAAGVTVDEKSSLNLSSVWSSVTTLAKILASLPLITYRRLSPEGKERALNHPVYQLLHLRPNQEQSAFQFMEMIMAHGVLWGNAYAQIVREGSGSPRELWPLLPWKMQTIERRGALKIYVYDDGEGIVRIPDYKILHIPGFSLDGMFGLKPVNYQRQTIGLSIAADEYGARFFGNEATPGGILTSESRVSPDARKRLVASWEDAHRDISQKHRIAVLEEGMKFQQVDVSPDKAQFLETRKHQISEAARIFDLPPHMVGDLERATFTNIEHQGLEFLTYSLRPWLVRFEQAMTIQLLDEREWNTYFIEFLVDALLRADVKTRYESYRIAKEIGVLSTNEIRAKENMNPVEDGDTYYVPLNWTPVDEPVEVQEELPEEEPAPENNSSRREIRTMRSATTRSRIAHSYRHVFSDIMQKIVNQERGEIKAAINSQLLERNVKDFDVWLTQYYQDLPEEMRRRLLPAYHSLAESIRGEIGDELDLTEDFTAQEQEFLGEYLESYIARYTGSSQGQIRAIIRDNSEADLAELLEERLDQWQERRPGKESLNETIRLSNAFAQTVYVLAGVTLFRWIALGAKTCPFCQQLDGQVVGREQVFVLPGSALEDENAGRLEVQSTISHPPIHAGCVCQIAPG